jgi:hypothetical protein
LRRTPDPSPTCWGMQHLQTGGMVLCLI